MAVKAKPDEYTSVTAYLFHDDTSKAIEFYKKAFGATELMRMPGPNGSVMHAEMQIGDARVMMADMAEKSPKQLGASSVSFVLYVDDVDAVFKRALGAGATQALPVEDKFYGDRMGTLTDPFGHEWSVATHVEDVSEQEMERRMKAAVS